MFADLDESIRQLLIQRGNLNAGEVDISFDLPSREWAAGISRPTIDLYLFDIRENTELKNPAPWMVQRGPNNTAIKSRPDIRVDVNYNITAVASAIEDEHRLLNRVLLILSQHPVLPEELLQGLVSGQEVFTYVANPSGIMQSPADYWGALDNDIKPSIAYRATVRLDLAQEISVGLALTSQLKVGYKVNGNGLGSMEELPFHIGGRVYQGGDPESGVRAARVTLVERALDAITGADGRYSFSGVPAGQYSLVISPPGIDELTRVIQVPSENYDIGI